jgi:hypothetical protein
MPFTDGYELFIEKDLSGARFTTAAAKALGLPEADDDRRGG